MTKLRSTPFQNCTKNVINDGGADTLGNILCEKMARFYQRDPPLNNTKIYDGITIGKANMYLFSNLSYFSNCYLEANHS